MAPAQFENTKNRLAAKLRHLTKKLVKPVISMLKNKSSKVEDIQQPMWMHPAELKLSEAEAENAANEALEAKLRELIVTEYTSRRKDIQHPLSLHIQGHLTIIPSAHPAAMLGTFWMADSDIHYRDCTQKRGQQRAEQQAPLRT